MIKKVYLCTIFHFGKCYGIYSIRLEKCNNEQIIRLEKC